MKTKHLVGIVSIGLLMAATACNEKEDIDLMDAVNNIDEAAITDISYASDVIDETIDLLDEAIYLNESQTSLKSIDGNGFQYRRLNDCVNVTRDVTDSLIIVTIDFGETNCEGTDGRHRRGAIVATHAGYYWNDTVEFECSFEGFHVDDNVITGYMHTTRTRNQQQMRVCNTYMKGSVIFADSSGTMTRSAERTRTMIQGSNTPNKGDDVCETTGSAEYKYENGLTIRTQIVNALMRNNELGCMQYNIQGVETIDIGEESTITIDYGDGTCDNYAEISQNGKTEVVSLKRRNGKTD